MTEELLQTKLFLPAVRRELVSRPHLEKRLSDGLRGRLTLVSAPAGFGKTTLIAQWARQLADTTDWATAWLSIDENDDEVGRFFVHFIACLQGIEKRLGEAEMELLRSPQAIDLDRILTNLINTVLGTGRSILIVLDDYHLITTPEIHKGVLFLLENAPPRFHLLIISRADPPFPVVRLRARNQLSEIRQADLRFSLAESGDFLNRLMDLDLPEHSVVSLEQRTEGWAAGLQLAALSLAGQTNPEAFIQSFSSSNRYIVDYLAEEVMARRPKGSRRFLLYTANLDRLSAPLCDAVLDPDETRPANSDAILDQLERANLFLNPLDEDRYWYRYHGLFANLLRRMGEREQPGLAKKVHSRASRWFEQSGYMEEAIQHAIAADDPRRAEGLLEAAGDAWIRQGEIGKIRMWTLRLPENTRFRNPRVTMNYAWALLFAGRANDAEAVLTQLADVNTETSLDLDVLQGVLLIETGNGADAFPLLQQAVSKLKTLEPTPINQNLQGLALNLLGLSHQIAGNGEQALTLYTEGIALSRAAGNLFAVLKATQGIARVLISQARLPEAEAVLLEAFKTEEQLAANLGMPGRRLAAVGQMHIMIGEIYLQWNRLSDAETHILDRGDIVPQLNQADRCLGLYLLARLRLAQNRVEAVPAILKRLLEIEQSGDVSHYRRTLMDSVAGTRIALYQHQPTPELKTTIEQSLPRLASDGQDPLIHAGALMILDRPQDVISQLEPVLKRADVGGKRQLWLEAAAQLCVAYRAAGNRPAALELLRKMLEIAGASGHIRAFFEAGDGLKPLLEALAGLDDAPVHVRTVLAAFPRPTRSKSETSKHPLSPREQEVLTLLAGGLTNQQIAEQLVIAPSTAKRHVINIYNKLGVNNRAEATARAYELGIVRLD